MGVNHRHLREDLEFVLPDTQGAGELFFPGYGKREGTRRLWLLE